MTDNRCEVCERILKDQAAARCWSCLDAAMPTPAEIRARAAELRKERGLDGDPLPRRAAYTIPQVKLHAELGREFNP